MQKNLEENVKEEPNPKECQINLFSITKEKKSNKVNNYQKMKS